MLAFSLFWVWGASEPLRKQLEAGGSPDLWALAFPAFGLLFVGFAGTLVLSPLLERNRAPFTFYALTDKRALIVIQGARGKVQSVSPSEFSLERRDKPDGRGDLILRRETRGSGEDARTSEIGFFGIERAREVERLARDLAQASP